MLNLFPYQSQNIIAICKKQKGNKNYHASYLGIFQEFITGFSSCYNLKKKKHNMAAVQSRDRQYIHNCQYNR